MSKTKHTDLEFHVEDANQTTHMIKNFDEAAGFAISIACAGKPEVYIDVLCWSRAAAVAYGGDHGGEVYDEDPETSIHERIVIRAESIGRVY